VARAPEAQPLRVLAGYSFGAAVALCAAPVLAVDHLVLIAPAVALFEPALLREYDGRVSIVVGGEDAYAPHTVLRALLSGSPQARLEVLGGDDHFFTGAGLARLRAALPALLG
jgi:alpha/beta superfamily hydrolase